MVLLAHLRAKQDIPHAIEPLVRCLHSLFSGVYRIGDSRLCHGRSPVATHFDDTACRLLNTSCRRDAGLRQAHCNMTAVRRGWSVAGEYYWPRHSENLSFFAPALLPDLIPVDGNSGGAGGARDI